MCFDGACYFCNEEVWYLHTLNYRWWWVINSFSAKTRKIIAHLTEQRSFEERQQNENNSGKYPCLFSNWMEAFWHRRGLIIMIITTFNNTFFRIHLIWRNGCCTSISRLHFCILKDILSCCIFFYHFTIYNSLHISLRTQY